MLFSLDTKSEVFIIGQGTEPVSEAMQKCFQKKG